MAGKRGSGVLRPSAGSLWGVTPETSAGRLQTLWLRVLLQAVLDAFCPVKNVQGKAVKPEAREQSLRWITSADCAEVVELAGYRAEWAMPRLADMVERHLAGETVITVAGNGYAVWGTVFSMARPKGPKQTARLRRAA